MKLVHVADRLFNTPLMVTEAKLNTILHAIGPRFDLNLELPEFKAAQDSGGRRSAGYNIENGTAVIPIRGSLVNRAGAMDALSGMTSYEAIGGMLDQALDDPAVEDIALDVDSPGGEANGCFDLADRIFEARQRKPITAVVNESAFSAAYLLASAASKIVIPRTGGAGSIGVIATHADFSKAEEKAGVTVTHIIAGAKKADWSQHKPLSESAAASLQELVNDDYRLFVDTVARNRNMPAETIRKTEAGIFKGQAAIRAGLADELVTISGSLSDVAHGRTAIKQSQMSAETEEPEPRTMDDVRRDAFANLDGKQTENQAEPEPPKSFEEIGRRVYGESK